MCRLLYARYFNYYVDRTVQKTGGMQAIKDDGNYLQLIMELK